MPRASCSLLLLAATTRVVAQTGTPGLAAYTTALGPSSTWVDPYQSASHAGGVANAAIKSGLNTMGAGVAIILALLSLAYKSTRARFFLKRHSARIPASQDSDEDQEAPSKQAPAFVLVGKGHAVSYHSVTLDYEADRSPKV